MSKFRITHTTLGGRVYVNVTAKMLADALPTVNLTSQVNGSNQDFTIGQPFRTGTLLVLVGTPGVLQRTFTAVSAQNAGAGTFSLAEAPDADVELYAWFVADPVSPPVLLRDDGVLVKLTGAMVAGLVRHVDFTVQADGVQDTFALGPYVTGTLHVWLAGVLQPPAFLASANPTTGVVVTDGPVPLQDDDVTHNEFQMRALAA